MAVSQILPQNFSLTLLLLLGVLAVFTEKPQTSEHFQPAPHSWEYGREFLYVCMPENVLYLSLLNTFELFTNKTHASWSDG